MAITNASRVVSRAGKAKNRKWDVKERFGVGHDSVCRSLLPENLHIPRRGSGIRSYHSETFGMDRVARISHDAQHLLDSGLADTAENAIDMAIDALNAIPTRAKQDINEVASYEPWRSRRQR